jgi:hypothetical protein
MTGLYSPINKLMEQVTRPKGTGAEYMAELQKKPGYKPAEAEDRDLQALMALPQMERAAFMEKLKAQANKYPLKMRELGEGQTHHETYTLPGGENYREILLHTPGTKRDELKKKLSDIDDLMNSPATTTEQYKKLYATRVALADQYAHGVEGSFPGNAAHFGGTPNILASVRVKDRTSPEGKKILHIEEIQSDWHQQGREHGYHPKDLYAQIRAATAEKRMMDRYLKEADEDSSDMAYGEYGRMMDDHQAATEKVDRLRQLKEEGAPYGPHAKDWHELALKAMIQHAAEKGYHQIAITPGAEQAKRFGLSKQVGSVSYNPETQHFQAFKPNRETIVSEKGASPERIKALIGKETAEKLMQAPQQMGHHYLEGEDLDMGGQGMKGFYDKMVPTFLNKFGKKHGVQVQPGAVDVPEGIESGWATKMKPAYQAPVHTFDITPGMREDVLKNGIPRYAEGGEVEVRPTNYDPNLQRKHPELEAAIRGIAAGTTTHQQLDKLIAKHKPIKPYEFVPQPATDADAERALKPAQKPKWRAHEQWPVGRKVGLRLDIPAYETHGVWVNSVHDEEGKGDDNLKVAYGPHSSVKNAVFDPTPHKAEEVGKGEKGKSSFARIKGELHHMTEDEAVEHMKTYLNHPDYAQVGFDPRRHGHFYDRKTMKPVTHSEHVVQIGPLVLAKNPKYGKRESYAEGGNVSRGTIKEKVTISPNMDVMQYELINKKVK